MFDEDTEDEGPVTISFIEEVVKVTVGGQATVGVLISPASAMTVYEVTYTIGNEDFATIYLGTKTEVILSGRAVGSTVLRASIADAEAEAEALVQVVALETEED
jgi:hypothetical protein